MTSHRNKRIAREEQNLFILVYIKEIYIFSTSSATNKRFLSFIFFEIGKKNWILFHFSSIFNSISELQAIERTIRFDWEWLSFFCCSYCRCLACFLSSWTKSISLFIVEDDVDNDEDNSLYILWDDIIQKASLCQSWNHLALSLMAVWDTKKICISV